MDDVALRPIDGLTGDWHAQHRSAPSREALQRLAGVEPAVAALGARDLGDVVVALRGARSRQERDVAAAVLRAMLRSQHVHPLVARAVLQAILPGLVTVARRLAWGSGGEWEGGGAFFIDVITTAWEVIVQWSGDDRPYAVLDLLSAVRCRLRRQLLHHRSVQERTGPRYLTADFPSVPDHHDRSSLDELARAIDEIDSQELDPGDAAVLYANRVLGYTMTELADMTGRSRRHLGTRRDRAVRALIA